MAGVAEVSYADFHCEKNNQEHRTAEISTKRLIVRRGQIFHITVQFNKSQCNPDSDRFALTAETGPRPSPTSGTKVLFPLKNSINAKKWSGVVVSNNGTLLSLAISSSPNAKIGRYTLSLLSSTDYQIKSFKLGEFILLFNPWCSDDEVFLDSAEQREEYVMNEDGIVYVGHCSFINKRPWYFGQFEENIVDICLKLLDNNRKCLNTPEKDYMRRNDPVYISRVVTAMVNCNDDRGILQGKWNEPYSGGAYPWSWNGSVAILHQWNRYGCRPVRYGQCWVYAAVACTVLRCLGIPTRVVTNFNSAHDTNGNLTIDKVYDERGRECGGQNDSIWNFHVWVESWMARNDLKSGHDGWQVLDPTPQEKSEGTYCCGPAPVNAIKEGAVDMKFDVPFVFAEVNADQVSWICRRDGGKEKISVETRHVGRNISTKSCGSTDRDDITHNYKYPEGSNQERAIFTKADLTNRPQREKKLQIHVKTDESVNHGSDIKVLISISNCSPVNMVCKLNFNAQIMKYNGIPLSQAITKNVQEIALEANEERTVPLEVSYSEYGNYLENQHLIKLIALAADVATNENVLAVKDVAVVNPDITIQILGQPILNQQLMAEISFRNPLLVPLLDCVFTIEGVGLIDEIQQMNVREIKVNETTTVTVQFTPKRMGPRKLLVDFDCNRIKDVKGFKNITVQCFKLI
ncbi:protein-glutamine gamma-glutamyltransferase 2-like [Heptranchias perlo]|uniref:protein-glutamine gamma-glutamyltransferase 2-like n=1 Tax=Heptranchias perlo TaxID=212740 RepID=UPI00355A7024